MVLIVSVVPPVVVVVVVVVVSVKLVHNSDANVPHQRIAVLPSMPPWE